MTTVPGITDPHGTQHCETSTLAVLLRHQGIDLSEPMLFGLGSGLSYIYWDAKSMGFPFVGGRVKPFVTRNLAAALDLDLEVRETTSPRRAWTNATSVLDAGRPLGLQLDSYHLPYFTSKVHFGGHILAMYGYDDHSAQLVDTAQQGGAVAVPLPDLAAARAARGPMTAKHRSFTLTAPPSPSSPPTLRDRIIPAITTCATAFLNPPIANLGNRGIAKTATRIRTWLDRTDNPQHDLPQAAVLMETAGTGGALFRNLYRDFLAECTQHLTASPHLRTGHRLYTEAATHWTETAALITKAGETSDPQYLSTASALLTDLAGIESEAMKSLLKLAE